MINMGGKRQTDILFSACICSLQCGQYHLSSGPKTSGSMNNCRHCWSVTSWSLNKIYYLRIKFSSYRPPFIEFVTLSSSTRLLIPLRCFDDMTRNGASFLLSVNQSIENVVWPRKIRSASSPKIIQWSL